MDAAGEHRNDVPQEAVAPRHFTSSLFVKVAAAKPEGWLRLDAIVRQYVVGSALKAGISAQDSEDLAQEVCGEIAAHIRDFRGKRTGSGLRAWVRTIMRNKITDYFRSRSHRPEGEPVAGDQTELSQIADRQPEMADFDRHTQEGRIRILDVAIALVRAVVEPRTWQAFREVELAGRAVAEVASELGITPHAASAAVYRVHHLVVRTAKELSAASDNPA